MIYDDVKKLSGTHTPRQLEKKFAKEFAKSPSGLLRAHQMAAKVARVDSANSRGGEIRAKVAEILKLNPNLNLHVAYQRAGVALGIL